MRARVIVTARNLVADYMSQAARSTLVAHYHRARHAPSSSITKQMSVGIMRLGFVLQSAQIDLKDSRS